MDALNLSMFRAYDIRTCATDLTEELSERLARAEARYFRDVLETSGILVAHDARSTGPRYLELAVEEYTRAGLEVTVIPGVCTTSMLYFAAMQHPDLAGVMFGASHNPAGDTGRKIFGPGVQPIAEHIGPEGGLDKIKELYIEDSPDQEGVGRGRIHICDPTEAYIAYSMELAGVSPGSLAGLTVFQDYLNGAAGKEMMLAFARAGANLIPMHYTADGSFPLGAPNPVKQDVIAAGMARLRASDATLGMFFDGDGDRIDFFNGEGEGLASSFVYAGILPELRARSKAPNKGIYADLKTNPLAILEMAHSGVTVNIIRNGHSQIKNALNKDTTMFGAVEESAHYYAAFEMDGKRFCTENTLYIALLVSRIWRDDPQRFRRLFEIQQHTIREREWGYLFTDDDQRQKSLDAVEAYFLEAGAQSRNRMDNGYDLEATMIRKGLPFEIELDTEFGDDWLQVCQRISQSEDGLARWEVLAANQELASEAKTNISQIVHEFGASEEYQG